MSDALALTVKFSALDKLSPALKAMAGLTRDASGALRKLKGDAKDLNRQMTDVQKRMASATGNVTGLVNEERRLAAAIDKTNRAIERQKAADRRTGNASRISQSMRSKGQDNLALGASIAAPFVLATRSAMQFQDGMTDIQLKAELTAAETTTMARNLEAIAIKTAQLPENIRAGVDVLAGFGMDPRQAVKAIGPIARVATAYRAQIDEIASATFSNIDNLKVPIASTTKMLDVMASAGKQGAFEIGDMAQYFPALTAAAAGLGQRGVPAVADLAAAAQIARKGAGDSASAANNLLNLLNKINSNDAIKNFKDFGIDLPAALKKAAKDGKTPIEAIAELTNKAVKGDMSQIGKLFQDAQVQAALRPLIANLDEYRRIRETSLKASGDVERDFATRMANGAAEWKKLAANGVVLANMIGATVLPAVNQLLGKAVAMASATAAWAHTHPVLFGYIVKGIALFAAFTAALGLLRISISFLIGPWVRLANLVIGAERLGAIFGVLRVGALGLAQGVLSLSVALLTNPITWIAIGIGLAALAIYNHWDWIKKTFNSAIAWIKSLTLKDVGYALIKGLALGMLGPLPMLYDTVTGIAGKIGGWFKGALGINSPSRVFMAYGGHISEGLARGIERQRTRPIGAVRRLTTGIATAGALGSAAVATAAPAAATRPQASIVNHFHITQLPGENAEGLARRVAELVDRQMRISGRSSYGED